MSIFFHNVDILSTFIFVQIVYSHHSLPEMEAVSDFVCRNNIFLFLQ